MGAHIDALPNIPVEGRITNDDTDLKDILQRTIRVKRQDGAEEWVTLYDKQKIESALLHHHSFLVHQEEEAQLHRFPQDKRIDGE
jgi:hypothetical protein